VRTDSTQVYDGPLTDLSKRTAELEKRVRDLEFAIIGKHISRHFGGTEYRCNPRSEPKEPPFRPGDRVCVYTGGDPCVKPGTVECQEHDGRWLVAIDRAGRIRVSECDMVSIPGGWK
jgi:hypothetical protein